MTYQDTTQIDHSGEETSAEAVTVEQLPYYNALTRQAYSAKNATLLHEAATLAGIECKAVAGFRQWLELGRVVKKGQHGTKIYMVVDKKDDATNKESDKHKVVKGATVFFHTQTIPLEGQSAETEPTADSSEPVTIQARKPEPAPLQALRHHVTGAIERGEGVAIVEQRAPVRQVVNKAPALRKLADGLQKSIDQAFYNRLENTPKRRKEAASARIEGYRLQRTQQALNLLADLHDAGTVPPELAEVTTKAKVYELMATVIDHSKGGYYDAGIDTGEPRYKTPDAVALWALIKPNPEALKTEELRREISRARQAGIPGFFPTPAPVADVMFERAEAHATFLEKFADFSAGDGALASEIMKRYPDANLSLVEINPTLCQILSSKGLRVNLADFLTLEPSPEFDCILLNPPFEDLQDIDHVQHAYKFLRPGGVLVSVMSPGPFFRTTAKANTFRMWCDCVNATIEDLPKGSFKASGTGVDTKLVTIARGF